MSEIRSHGYREFDQNLGEVSPACREFILQLPEHADGCLREMTKVCVGKKLNLVNRSKCGEKQARYLPVACREKFITSVNQNVCLPILEASCAVNENLYKCASRMLVESNPNIIKCRLPLKQQLLQRRLNSESLPSADPKSEPCALDVERFCSTAKTQEDIDSCLVAPNRKLSSSCQQYQLKRQILNSCLKDLLSQCALGPSDLIDCLRSAGANVETGCAEQIKRWPSTN